MIIHDLHRVPSGDNVHAHTETLSLIVNSWSVVPINSIFSSIFLIRL